MKIVLKVVSGNIDISLFLLYVLGKGLIKAMEEKKLDTTIKEFSPLVIAAMAGLLAAGIVIGYLTPILIFVLFLGTLLLSYLFINSLGVNGTIKITLESIIMATILTAIITNMVFQVTCVNILLMLAIILVAASIIIAYRNRRISVFFIFR